MTTVQTMLSGDRSARTRATALFVAVALVLALSLGVGGCSAKPELVAPEALISPYEGTGGQVLWAVAPLANESGTSVVDAFAVGDALVGKITEVHGLAAVPMNRTIAAMRALRMPAVRSPADARQLADALGVDGVIIGSVTAYDPYDPPTLGLTLALYGRQAHGRRAADAFDPRDVSTSPVDRTPPALSSFPDAPLVVVTEHLPGANHAVQMRLRQYAEGRTRQGSALGWRRYLASMELYTDFAAHWAVRRLLEEERLRLARAPRVQADPLR